QSGIEGDQSVSIDLDLAREAAVERFESVAPTVVQTGVALALDGEVQCGQANIGDGDLARGAAAEPEAPDRQGVGERRRRDVDVDRAVELWQPGAGAVAPATVSVACQLDRRRGAGDMDGDRAHAPLAVAGDMI